MKIEEAIRILKIIEEDCDRLNEPYSKEATKLGIEALKAHKKAQDNLWNPPGFKLPGETDPDKTISFGHVDPH